MSYFTRNTAIKLVLIYIYPDCIFPTTAKSYFTFKFKKYENKVPITMTINSIGIGLFLSCFLKRSCTYILMMSNNVIDIIDIINDIQFILFIF